MSRAEIENFFSCLNLETEEERARMRFESMVVERPVSVQVYTTDTTLCEAKLPETHQIA